MTMFEPGIGKTGLDRIVFSETIRSNMIKINPLRYDPIQYSFYFTPPRSDLIRFLIRHADPWFESYLDVDKII